MKWKYLDIGIQTLLFLTAVASIIAGLPRFNVLYLLFVQYLVGVYQLISCGVSLIFSENKKFKVVHFILSIIYLSALFAFTDNPALQIMNQPLLMIPPWLLAVYYYAISFPVRSQKRTRFLPNIGF